MKRPTLLARTLPAALLLAAALAHGLPRTAHAADLAADLTVDAAAPADPAHGHFQTVQAALDAIPANNAAPVRVLIAPGKYVEYLSIPKNKPFITFLGQGKTPAETVLSYHYKSSDPKPAALTPSVFPTNAPPANAAAPAPAAPSAPPAAAAASAPPTVGTTGSASTTINANDFTAENLTFENSAGDGVGQAVALKTNGDRLVFRNCRFTGFQDTLYPAGMGRCYFQNCYITGNTDFIFGNATAVFDHCTINASSPRLNYYTAANTAPTTAYGYVFLDCKLTASPGVQPGAVYLGRPWQYGRSKAAVAFIRCTMGPHVNPAGWNPWDAGNTKPEETTRYSEYASLDPTGKPLDISKRVTWSHQLTAEEAATYTPEKILAGNDHWNPTAPPASPKNEATP